VGAQSLPQVAGSADNEQPAFITSCW